MDAAMRVLTLSIHRISPFPRQLSLTFVLCQCSLAVANRCLSFILPPTYPTNTSYPISSDIFGVSMTGRDICGLPHTVRVIGMFYNHHQSTYDSRDT